MVGVNKYVTEEDIPVEILDIDEEMFWEIADRYRAPHLWERKGGVWNLKQRVESLEQT